MSKTMFQKAYALLLLVVMSCPVWAQTDQERAEALFQEGYILYQQHYSPNAFTKFKEAAQLGHAEAAYYAGNILRRNHTFITEEAEQFYRQAAEGGDVYAMLRLAQDGNFCGTLRDCDYDHEEWIDRALETALPRAEGGDSEAMMELFSVYWAAGERGEAFEWTEKAAENGHAFAQFWLAVGLLDERDMGFYWTEEGRREDILKWLRASAEQGFPKAILKLAVELKEDGRFEEANEWVDRMGQTDYFDALFNYGLILLDGPEGMFRYPAVRPVEGLAALIALQRQTDSSEVERAIDDYKETLDADVIAEAEARSDELLVDTPILHYLPKFGI
ncbi:tetratricopeptide repeat protein [Marinobacter nitratireducens]|nr:sel1 repeat family protein [Marinobacter nitratireducens]